MSRFEEYESYDAVGLAELVRKGQVNPEEILDAAIALAEERNPKLNAIVVKMYDEAKAAVAEGGQPYGAALVRNGEIIATGRNRVNQNGDPTSHAEMEAFRAAGLQMSYGDTVMYATALPCWMCAGAIAWFRVSKVIVGATWPVGDTPGLMRSRGVEVVLLELDDCKRLIGR